MKESRRLFEQNQILKQAIQHQQLTNRYHQEVMYPYQQEMMHPYEKWNALNLNQVPGIGSNTGYSSYYHHNTILLPQEIYIGDHLPPRIQYYKPFRNLGLLTGLGGYTGGTMQGVYSNSSSNNYKQNKPVFKIPKPVDADKYYFKQLTGFDSKKLTHQQMVDLKLLNPFSKQLDMRYADRIVPMYDPMGFGSDPLYYKLTPSLTRDIAFLEKEIRGFRV